MTMVNTVRYHERNVCSWLFIACPYVIFELSLITTQGSSTHYIIILYSQVTAWACIHINHKTTVMAKSFCTLGCHWNRREYLAPPPCWCVIPFPHSHVSLVYLVLEFPPPPPSSRYITCMPTVQGCHAAFSGGPWNYSAGIIMSHSLYIRHTHI